MPPLSWPKLAAGAAAVLVLGALLLLWRGAAGARDVARAERDKARSEAVAAKAKVAETAAALSDLRARCDAEGRICSEALEGRDALLREWATAQRPGAVRSALGRLLSDPGARLGAGPGPVPDAGAATGGARVHD